MITVTQKVIKEVEETFGLIDTHIIWCGRPLMIKVPVDLSDHEIDRIERSADRLSDMMERELRRFL